MTDGAYIHKYLSRDPMPDAADFLKEISCAHGSSQELTDLESLVHRLFEGLLTWEVFNDQLGTLWPEYERFTPEDGKSLHGS